MTKKIKVGIIGATGYAGTELVRILSAHPYAELTSLSSVSFGGKDISAIYPGFRAGMRLVLEEDPEKMLAHCDVVFASLPHGLSQEIAAKAIAAGNRFIDLGADFRLEDEKEYKDWYDCEFLDQELQSRAVYGLCELFREQIVKTDLVANPGCYPTSVALGLYPALKNGLVSTEGIIVDSKSGVSGAGRTLSQATHFPDCNEAFSAYKAGSHRHRPEIEQTLSKIADTKIVVTFTPHLLPVNRGILSTMYCERKTDFATLRRSYEEAYADEPFVVVLADGEYANIKNVRMTNCCHISLHEDPHTNKFIVCSAIDNMVKGAAGQAIQNMNLLFGFEETAGLPLIAPAI
ncbi:MAG: N-acetyl-gamma-glutamyl-phosphate reductase [Eubacteriales bacterium]|nr:N-acetyl-gamma-glutamyl-phosphate reductase [Eubacteriales bacterium]MDD3350778.1 N-acetyl-gamma-glutamyl-phosphate reductase [Eubacteriales bacterium]